jgi:hypothetical protein
MSRTILAVVALACLLGLAAVQAQEELGWVNVSDNLTGSVEGYDPSVPGDRGVGGVAVDRHSGDVLMALNGPPYGLYRSSDAGETWTRIDDGYVGGGFVRSFGIRVNPDNPDHIAAFRGTPPAAGEHTGSAYTLDGGESWHPLEDTGFGQGFKGYVHGMVDWSQDPVHVAAQTRFRPTIMVSINGGEKFDKSPWGNKFCIVEYNWNHDWLRANEQRLNNWKSKHATGYAIDGGYVMAGRYDVGIQRVEIGAEEAPRSIVSSLIPSAHTAVKLDGKLYWGAETGVIVSEDGGASWEQLGSELPMVRKGPFFGKDASEMVVVAEDGVYRTTDSCENWTKISDLVRIKDAWRADLDPLWVRTDYAWDHTRNVLYVTGLAGSGYKLEVK